jgi:hypothetical protein
MLYYLCDSRPQCSGSAFDGRLDPDPYSETDPDPGAQKGLKRKEKTPPKGKYLDIIRIKSNVIGRYMVSLNFSLGSA